MRVAAFDVKGAERVWGNGGVGVERANDFASDSLNLDLLLKPPYFSV